jgi:predicted phage tail protein
MLRKIKLYGRLAKFVGQRVFEADVASAAEAVRFLLANFPQLEKHMADQHYRVSVGKYALTLDELHDPAGQQEIRIVPVLAGAGSGASKIFAGVALIALAFVIGPAAGGFLGIGAGLGGATGAGAALSLGLVGGAFASAVGFIGLSLVVGGVAQLLTPTPKINAPGTPQDNNDPRKSYSFSGIQQTSRQGVPVPIVYGETIVGSVVVSAGIDTVQVTA